METSQIINELRNRFIAFDATGNHKIAQLFKESADLIEELQDKPWVESVLVDKLNQQIDELENDKTNLEAEIINLEIALDKAHCELEAQLPKEGVWIMDENPHDGDCRCSACLVAIDAMHERNHGLLNALTGGKWWKFYRYCPKCGARMRGEHDG